MKKEKKEFNELIDVINSIKKIYEENNNSIPVEKSAEVNKLFSEAHVIEKSDKKASSIAGIVLLAALFLLAFFFYTLQTEIDQYSDSNWEKEKIIRELDSRNKTLNLYVRGEESKDSTKKDSTNNNLSITTINGKIQTYFDLDNRLDSIDSLYKVKTIEKLKAEIEVLEGKNKISDLEFTLNYIKEKYGITVNIIPKETSKEFQLIAPKLDSALMLYPYFKNKLSYNKEKNIWYIGK